MKQNKQQLMEKYFELAQEIDDIENDLDDDMEEYYNGLKEELKALEDIIDNL